MKFLLATSLLVTGSQAFMAPAKTVSKMNQRQMNNNGLNMAAQNDEVAKLLEAAAKARADADRLSAVCFAKIIYIYVFISFFSS